MRNDSVFQALADPTRRSLLKLLQSRDMTPGEMVGHFSMTKPSLSHHLDILKKADLVVTQRSGQNIVYSLNLSVFEEVVSTILDMLGASKKSISNKG
jgi:ArsR family transcriptional regulator, arsenate/arsenite/antimonite-responsive transcriptional repressor